MDAAARAHAFEPFFTTKTAGKGTGLGLATVYGIVKQSDGYIRLRSEPGEGTSFEIYFPRVQAVTAEYAARTLAAEPAEAVAVVDDDETFRRLAARELRNAGLHVMEFADGAEALRAVGEYSGRLRVLITDVVMPGVSGVALAHAMAAARPGLKVVFMSGFTDERVTQQQGKALHGAVFLRKPFDARVLSGSVRAMLAEE
jgi:CheY-like chemotaxis protein